MRRRIDAQGRLLFDGVATGEEVARWTVPRPGYMREAEPLAHPAAWPSQNASRVDQGEQELNRQLFTQRRSRRKAAASCQLPASEKKTG